MRCIVCNCENSANDEFCKNCGTRLDKTIGNTSYKAGTNDTVNQYGEYNNRAYYDDVSEGERYTDTRYNTAYNSGDAYYSGDRSRLAGPVHDGKKGRGLLVSLIAVIVILLSGVIGLGAYVIMDSGDEPQTTVISDEPDSDKKDDSVSDDEDSGDDTQNDMTDDEELTEEEDTEVDTSQIKKIDDTPKKGSNGGYSKTNGRYRVVKSDVTWYGANTQAREAGGHLICINSYSELMKATELAQSAGMRIFWAGAHREVNQSWDGVYWQDGTPLSMSLYWIGIEPTYTDTSTGRTEDCLVVHKVGNDWGLNDTSSYISDYHGGKMGYIIEFDY